MGGRSRRESAGTCDSSRGCAEKMRGRPDRLEAGRPGGGWMDRCQRVVRYGIRREKGKESPEPVAG